MNIPNALTISRILLVPVFTILIINDYFQEALIVFFVAGITDGLDGFVARMWDQQTKLGTILDPIADKTLLDTAYILMSIKAGFPSWLTIIVVSRDIILVAGGVLIVHVFQKKDIEFPPTILGKATTVFQILTIFWALWCVGTTSVLLQPFIFITAVLTVASSFGYIYRGIKMLG